MVNLAVAAKPGDQVQPKIRPTPDGGSYISWFDNDPNGHPPSATTSVSSGSTRMASRS